MGDPLTAAEELAALKIEVERLRLLEAMWLARVAWTEIGDTENTEKELKLWQVYDNARKAYEAWRKP